MPAARPRLASAAATFAALALVTAGCRSSPPAARWPKSAGAIVPDDPADDGGESLAPRGAGEAAAIEHGGEDLTRILDEKPVTEPPTRAPETPAAEPAPDATPDATPELTPIFEETIELE